MSAADARSFLFVPGDRPDRFDKAASSGADAVIVDLEDAVAPEHKPRALANVLAWTGSGHRAVVRVNGIGTPWHRHELEVLAGTDAVIMVPKSQSGIELAAIRSVVGDRIIALVETARGIRDIDAVAGAAGVVRLAIGNVDLAVELGVDPASHAALAYSRGRLVVASAAAGLAPPVDGVTTFLETNDALVADLVMARELGFGAKMCLHPRQVSDVNIAFCPTDEEIAWARRVIATTDLAGVRVVDGAMIDAPVIARARSLLAGREARG